MLPREQPGKLLLPGEQPRKPQIPMGEEVQLLSGRMYLRFEG